MSVPNTFATSTTAIPLVNLDANFQYYDNAYQITSTSISFTGAVTLAAGTANGVAYLNGSKGLTTGSALFFDGVRLGVGTTAPNARLQVSGTNTGATLVAAILSNEGATAGSTVRLNFLTGEDGTVGRTRAIIEALSPSANDGALAFYARNAGTAIEQMRLTSTGLGIGTSSPNASAILDAQSTTKGVRMPNMTTTQKNAIASPAAGLMVFDTTLAKLCVYTGAAWQIITSV